MTMSSPTLQRRPPGRVSWLLSASKTLTNATSIAFGLSPTEKPGYGILWVPYVRFYPLEALSQKDRLIH